MGASLSFSLYASRAPRGGIIDLERFRVCFGFAGAALQCAQLTYAHHRNRSPWTPTTILYPRLALMAALSFVAMFVLMYAMVDRLSNVYPSLNQAYMAALMPAPMVAIEIVLMSSMYPSKRTNRLILAGSAFVLLGAFWAIRDQAAIGDDEFLRSMIPHHSDAILMCQQASISDAEIRRLCADIVSSQRQEIETMKQMLERRR